VDGRGRVSVATSIICSVGEVFRGSAALRDAALTEHQLRTWYRPIFRDVYVPRFCEPSLDDRIIGAWLWSRRKATIAGVAAAALHGAAWIDADTPIELITRNARLQRGLVVRDETLNPDEVTRLARVPVTTVARTAFDLGRHLPRDQALARLDALMRATPFSIDDVNALARRPYSTWAGRSTRSRRNTTATITAAIAGGL
jgi:hypothetical protein